jgi:sugar lactone lactonase YvrE
MSRTRTVSTLQSGLTSVLRIAADTNKLYWTDPVGGTIRSLPKSGGTSTVLATHTGNSPSGIAVDSTYVYWTQMVNSGYLMRVPVNGGTATFVGYFSNTPVGPCLTNRKLLFIASSYSLSVSSAGFRLKDDRHPTSH